VKTKHVVALTENERKFVQKIINDKTTTPTYKKRAQILLALDTNTDKPQTQKITAQKIDITPPTIHNTLKQHHTNGLNKTLQFKTPPNPTKTHHHRRNRSPHNRHRMQQTTPRIHTLDP
jgi:hypothetical protein